VGSRTNDQLTDLDGVRHFTLDVKRDPFILEKLPEIITELVYCPRTIRLKPFQRLTIDDFLEDLQINFLGAVKTIQACLKQLKKSSTPASVVLFCTVAVKTGMPFHTSVAGAKTAVEGFSRSLAAEFAPRIRVKAIAPSLTDTPLKGNLLSSEEKRQASADRHPLKRIGTSQEVAHLASYLLSDAIAWLTDQIIHIDGGMSTLKTFKYLK
jgi:NAD(P)-dependent dehydrogenase (short-subunit alcohol dehydrogenase family)